MSGYARPTASSARREERTAYRKTVLFGHTAPDMELRREEHKTREVEEDGDASFFS